MTVRLTIEDRCNHRSFTNEIHNVNNDDDLATMIAGEKVEVEVFSQILDCVVTQFHLGMNGDGEWIKEYTLEF